MKIFCDTASINHMRFAAADPRIKGFTTNPTLLRQNGVSNYEHFGRAAAQQFPHHCISFEVVADDFADMEKQAHKIAAWGANVYVKIPITNCAGESSAPLIARLSAAGIPVNVTAVFTNEQIDAAAAALDARGIISIFAGRIADTGREPEPFIAHAVKVRRNLSHEILWASTRQVLDAYTADDLGCDIVTMTPDLIPKLPLKDKDLAEYSRETVKQFYEDAQKAGLTL